MGLAASQARLLTITARLADNELRSQTINNAKMRLATQSSQASENYINALNDATLKFANYDTTGVAKTQTLNYNALTAYSSYNTQYGLVNSSGQLLVSEEEAALYEKSNENLDTYLQYHGLTYDTTYFDEIGNVTNTGYPDEFSVLTVSDMKEIYKNYSSIENSQEVETFNNAYNEYKNTCGTLLQSVCSKVLKQYLLSSTEVTNTLSDSAGYYELTMSGGSLAQKFTNLKKMFNDTNNSTSNPDGGNNFALNDPIISYLLANNSTTKTAIDDIFNSVTINGNDLSVENEETINYTEDTTAGTKTYEVQGVEITIDSSTGAVTNVVAPTSDSTTTITFVAGTDMSSIANYVKGMSITYAAADGSTSTTEQISFLDAKLNTDGSLYVKSKDTIKGLTDSTMQDQYLNDLIVDGVISTILNDLSVDFAKALYDNTTPVATQTEFQQIVAAAGVDLTAAVSGSKTLKDIFDDADAAEDQFITTIFSGDITDTSSPAYYVKNLIDNDTTPIYYTDEKGINVVLHDEVDASGNPIPRALTYEDLTDVDFLLRFMNANSENVQMSETFKTVVKEFMMDNIIAEYGTPKYAWQDSTDPNNTGNADAKAQWYTNLFNRMRQGYKALENGLASSNEWIEYALESGIVTMEQVDGSYEWQGLDYKACAKITEETDDAAVTKAEAEYNRAMNDIESKDNIYDIELKNIDTEHSSLQTEYDSIKTVISKNVERTFNFYKNA